MLNLYETTKEQSYLDAVASGVKQYMQYTWFYPVMPKSSLVVNKNVVVAFRSIEAKIYKIPAMLAPSWKCWPGGCRRLV